MAPEEVELPKPAWIDDVRELRDPKDMRALAHPTRLALIEVLTLYGPMTATQAAGHVGESPSSCSFHLRTLARHGFVEETGEGTGRQRPWRLRHLGTSIDRNTPDVGARAAADTLVDLYLGRQLARFQQARDRERSQPDSGGFTVSSNETVAWLTPTEARALVDEVMELLMRYRERITDPSLRPEGSRPIETIHLSYPTEFGTPPT